MCARDSAAAANCAPPVVHRKSNYFTEMCSGSEAGLYLRLIDFVSLTARLESNKEEEEGTP